MTELGLDPKDLGRMDFLRPKLKDMLRPHLSIADSLNDKQLLDKLIEKKIEHKSALHPAFIMNHPLLLSPLAKSQA
jgi:lysyl-tRNA synthetase class II